MRFLCSILSFWAVFFACAGDAYAIGDSNRQIAVGQQLVQGVGPADGWQLFVLDSVGGNPTFGNVYSNVRYANGCGIRDRYNDLNSVSLVLRMPYAAIREDNADLHRFIAMVVPMAVEYCEQQGTTRGSDTTIALHIIAPELERLGVSYSLAHAEFRVGGNLGGGIAPSLELVERRLYVEQLLTRPDYDLELISRAVQRNLDDPVAEMRRMEQEQLYNFCDAPPLDTSIVVNGQNVRLLSPPEICTLRNNLYGFSNAYVNCLYDRDCDAEDPETKRFVRSYVGPAYTVLAHNLRHYLQNKPAGLPSGVDYLSAIGRLVYPSIDRVQPELTGYFELGRDYAGNPRESWMIHRGSVMQYQLIVGEAYMRARLDDRDDGFYDDVSTEQYQALMLRPPSSDVMTAARYAHIVEGFEQDRRRRAAQQERDAPLELLAGFILFGMAVHLASPYDANAASEAWTPDTPIHTFGYSANDLLIGNPFPRW